VIAFSMRIEPSARNISALCVSATTFTGGIVAR
jgi:hypothetical protein